MTIKQAAHAARMCQDAPNGRGIARSMVEAMDAVAELPECRSTAAANRHPITFLFLYQLMTLNGHEPLHLSNEWSAAMKACKLIADAPEKVEDLAA